jgi:SRSO17 transposase
MTEEKIPLAKLYVVIGGSTTTLWQKKKEKLPHRPCRKRRKLERYQTCAQE